MGDPELESRKYMYSFPHHSSSSTATRPRIGPVRRAVRMMMKLTLQIVVKAEMRVVVRQMIQFLHENPFVEL